MSSNILLSFMIFILILLQSNYLQKKSYLLQKASFQDPCIKNIFKAIKISRMYNPQLQNFILAKSTKALQKPVIQKKSTIIRFSKQKNQNKSPSNKSPKNHLSYENQKKNHFVQFQTLKNISQLSSYNTSNYLRMSQLQTIAATSNFNNPLHFHTNSKRSDIPTSTSFSLFYQQSRSNLQRNKSQQKQTNRESIISLDRQLKGNQVNDNQNNQNIENNHKNKVTSRWNESKKKLNFTVKKFSQIQSNVISENNSPRRHIQGAEQVFDSSKLMTITMKNFNTLDPLIHTARNDPSSQKRATRGHLNYSLNLPQIFQLKTQIYHEKDQFYKMHPYMLQRQNVKSLQQRKDKRRNLLGLEELYIRQRNKQTKKIYGLIKITNN